MVSGCVPRVMRNPYYEVKVLLWQKTTSHIDWVAVQLTKLSDKRVGVPSEEED